MIDNQCDIIDFFSAKRNIVLVIHDHIPQGGENITYKKSDYNGEQIVFGFHRFRWFYTKLRVAFHGKLTFYDKIC